MTDDNIRQRRERLGLNASELARRAGLDRQTLAKIERGGSCRVVTLRAIEDVLAPLEAERRLPAPTQKQPIRFIVEGHRGTTLTVETSPENYPAFEALVDRIMHNLRTSG